MEQRAPKRRALDALTAAALTLPGLSSHAAGTEVEFGYSHYAESERENYGQRARYQPISVDSSTLRANTRLHDRVTLRFGYAEDTWSGATPMSTAPQAGEPNRGTFPGMPLSGASPFLESNFYVDQHLQPYRFAVTPDGGFAQVPDQRAAHVMSYASPETRRAGDFALAFDGGDIGLSVAGGLSVEEDYVSNYVALGARVDFDRKRTTLDVNVRRAHAEVAAKLDRDAYSYYDSTHYRAHLDFETTRDSRTITLRDDRDDWTASASLARVLTRHLLLAGGFEYTRSSGYQGNPYKVTEFVFADLRGRGTDFGVPGVPVLYDAFVRGLLEQRPDIRNQFTLHGELAYDIARWDAALHVGYRYSHDDWDISAHTFDLEWSQRLPRGWQVAPRVRYYSQGRADFYHRWILVREGIHYVDIDPNDPSLGFREDYAWLPYKYFSSDHRLSGYGALSGGVSVVREFADGALRVEAGAEYYLHAGHLKLGGGGEGAYADFDGYVLNGVIGLDLERAFAPKGDGASAHGEHDAHHGTRRLAPVGLDHVHGPLRAGEFMFGYRYGYAQWSGDFLHGTQAVDDSAILEQACAPTQCATVTREMSMNMHMLDLMYAPSDWLTLVVMPQFMDMSMAVANIPGAPVGGGHHHGGAGDDTHTTGGVGDTTFGALVKLHDVGTHAAHLGLMLRAPSGDYAIRHGNVRIGNFMHYDMQTGSGTWDLAPSLTWNGQWRRWSFGAQGAAVVRVQGANGAGYRLGDRLETSLWSGCALTDWLGVTLRVTHTLQGAVHGQFKPAVLAVVSGPMDLPDNTGGRYFDLGAGLSAKVMHGTLSVEWLAPVSDDVNGFQRERAGTLFAGWSTHF
jgi:hypothetical protein